MGNPTIHYFTDLEAWKQGHALVLSIYKNTENFPSSEQFGLTNQMRRAVVSITSNIAEGFSRRSKKEKIQFYSTALSSLTEIQNQLVIARDVQYYTVDTFKTDADRSIVVSKLINGLIKSAESRTVP